MAEGSGDGSRCVSKKSAPPTTTTPSAVSAAAKTACMGFGGGRSVVVSPIAIPDFIVVGPPSGASTQAGCWNIVGSPVDMGDCSSSAGPAWSSTRTFGGSRLVCRALSASIVMDGSASL